MAIGTPVLVTQKRDNATDTTTSNFTVTAGEMILAVLQVISAGTPTPFNITDSVGLTWTLIGVANRAESFGNEAMCQVWAAVSTGVSMNVTAQRVSLGNASCFSIISISGADPNDFTNWGKDEAGFEGDAGDPSLTLPTTPAADSTVMGFMHGSSGSAGGITPPTGYTELTEFWVNSTGTHRGNIVYDASSPAQTLTWTSDTTNAVALAVELKVASQNLTVGLFSNSQSFFDPTVAPGAISLTPSLFSDSQTFHSPSISQGRTLQPSLISNYPERVTNGDASNGTTGWGSAGGSITNVSGKFRVSNSINTFTYAVQTISVTPGRLHRLTADIIPGTAAVYSIKVGTGSNDATYGSSSAASVDLSFTPSGSSVVISLYSEGDASGNVYTDFDNISVKTTPFFASTITQSPVLAPALFSNTQSFYAPTVTTGAVTISPSVFTNSQTFYSPTVVPEPTSLYPTLLRSYSQFPSAEITPYNRHVFDLQFAIGRRIPKDKNKLYVRHR